MTTKDLAWVEQLQEVDRLGGHFRFWNGVQFGLCVGIFATLGTCAWKYMMGVFVIACIPTTIYLHKHGKAIDELREM